MSIQQIAKRDTDETIQTNVRLPKPLYDELKQVSEERSVPMTLIVISGIRTKLKEVNETNQLVLEV